MLDWDKPLQEIGGIKIKPVAKNYDGPFGTGEYGGYAWHLGDTQISRAHRTSEMAKQYAPHGSEIIKELNSISQSPTGHSAMLSNAGIPGIKYLDASSRGAPIPNISKYQNKIAALEAKVKLNPSEANKSLLSDAMQELQSMQRAANEVTSNFVVFDPAHMKILGRE